MVPEHGSLHLDHRHVLETGKRLLPAADAGAAYTVERNYSYAIDSSPKTSALLRDSLRTIGTGLEKALRSTFDAYRKANSAVPELAKLAVEYATSPAWAATGTFDGAAAAHWVDPSGKTSDSPIADTTKDNQRVLSDKQAVAFVVGRLARFLWRHAGAELDSAAVLALVGELIAAIPAGSTEPETMYAAGLWVQAVAERDAVYRRRAACVLIGLFFDCGPDGHWWPNAVKQGPGGQRLPCLRDLPPFHNTDDSTIGILEATVVDSASRGQYIGLLEVPKPSSAGFSIIIGGHSHCSFTDGNRFVAAAAASALAGCECRLVTGATAGWTVREPEQYSKDGATSTGLVEVLSNTLYFDPNWTKTRAEKVPFVGILALKMRSDVVSECFYRVLRSAETLDRETIRRAEYELGTESLDPPPWAQRSGVTGSCDYRWVAAPPKPPAYRVH